MKVKMYPEESEPQITLIIESEPHQCSKRLLEVHSDYFNAMFNCGMKESRETTIELHEVSSLDFTNLYECLINDRCDLTFKTLPGIIHTASMLQFCGLIKRCESFLLEHLSPDTCMKCLALAYAYDMEELKFHAMRCSLWHLDRALKENSLDGVTEDLVVDILRSRTARLSSESVLLNWIIDWLEFYERMELFPSLVRHINLANITEEEVDHTKRRSIFRRCPDTIALFESQLQLNKSNIEEREPRNMLLCDINPGQMEHNLVVIDFDEKHTYTVPPPSFDSNLIGYTVTHLDGVLYVCGGEKCIGSGRWNSDIWSYDLFTQRWQVVSKLPKPRRNHLALAMDSEIFLIGGWGRYRIKMQPKHNNNSFIDVFSTKSGTWRSLPNLPQELYDKGGQWDCMTVDQKLVIINEHGSGLKLYYMDPKCSEKTWTVVEAAKNADTSTEALINCLSIHVTGGRKLQPQVFYHVKYHSDVGKCQFISRCSFTKFLTKKVPIFTIEPFLTESKHLGLRFYRRNDQIPADQKLDSKEALLTYIDPNSGKYTELMSDISPWTNIVWYPLTKPGSKPDTRQWVWH